MELSTLRQAPRSDKLRTVQSIVAQWPLKMICALLRARRRATFRRSCVGFSVVRFSGADIAASFPRFKVLCQKAVTFWCSGMRDLYLVGRASRRPARSRSVNHFACKCAKFCFHAIREPPFRLPAIMLQPSISLDFRRQRHHVKMSALLRMLTFWPRDERSPFSLPGVQRNFLRLPRPRGASPQNSVAAAPDFPARAPAQRKTNN